MWLFIYLRYKMNYRSFQAIVKKEAKNYVLPLESRIRTRLARHFADPNNFEESGQLPFDQ